MFKIVLVLLCWLFHVLFVFRARNIAPYLPSTFFFYILLSLKDILATFNLMFYRFLKVFLYYQEIVALFFNCPLVFQPYLTCCPIWFCLFVVTWTLLNLMCNTDLLTLLNILTFSFSFWCYHFLSQLDLLLFLVSFSSFKYKFLIFGGIFINYDFNGEKGSYTQLWY